MDDLVTFVRARLDDEERIALAASGEYSRAATEPEHWRWECEEDDRPLDPDLAIAGGEEFLGHDDHYRIGLRSLEEYPSAVPGMRPLVHLALGGCEEVAPQVARHIARHDPARALREVAAGRKALALYECAAAELSDSPGDPKVFGWARAAEVGVRDRAAVWDGHPDYRQEWKP